jgi:hypothetical protein
MDADAGKNGDQKIGGHFVVTAAQNQDKRARPERANIPHPKQLN